MELWAIIIALVALVVALPGTIDATWNVIAKYRALKKKDTPQNYLESKPSGSRAPLTSSGPGSHPVVKPDRVTFGGYLRSTLAHEKAHRAMSMTLKKIQI